MMIDKLLEGEDIRNVLLEQKTLSELDWFKKIARLLSDYFGFKKNWGDTIGSLEKNLYDYEFGEFNPDKKEEISDLIGALERIAIKLYDIQDVLESYKENLERYIGIRL